MSRQIGLRINIKSNPTCSLTDAGLLFNYHKLRNHVSISDFLIPLKDDIWLEVSRQRSTLPASAHSGPDCRGNLHQFTAGAWLRQLLVLIDGCLYVYSDIEPDAPATGKKQRYMVTLL